MPPHGPIIMASHPKAVIFFYGPFCRSLYPVHIYKSKLSFTLFKSCTWSKVLCTGHCTATSGNALTPIEHWQKISSVSGRHIVKELFVCKKQSNSKHLLGHCILIFKTKKISAGALHHVTPEWGIPKIRAPLPLHCAHIYSRGFLDRARTWQQGNTP
jgi:hypothetical protein